METDTTPDVRGTLGQEPYPWEKYTDWIQLHPWTTAFLALIVLILLITLILSIRIIRADEA